MKKTKGSKHFVSSFNNYRIVSNEILLLRKLCHCLISKAKLSLNRSTHDLLAILYFILKMQTVHSVIELMTWKQALVLCYSNSRKTFHIKQPSRIHNSHELKQIPIANANVCLLMMHFVLHRCIQWIESMMQTVYI